MDSIFGIDLDSFLTGEKLSSFVRLGIWIIVGIPVIHLISRWFKRMTRDKISDQQAMIFQKLIVYIGYVIIAFSVLNILGFEISTLLGAAGIVGIAVGFASQTSVSNIISGWFLIAEKPFIINDVITVGTTTGIVLSIDTLSIKMRTFDNKFVRIPNETLIKSEVINNTRFPIRRVDINIGVAYKEDVAHVKSVLMDIARNNPLCLNEPEPLIIFSGFGTSSLDFLYLVWAVKEDWLKLKNSIMEEIKSGFDKEGIEIPFPHVSLYSGSVTEPFPVHLVTSTDKTTQDGSKNTS